MARPWIPNRLQTCSTSSFNVALCVMTFQKVSSLFEAAEETAPALLESGDQVRWRVVDRAEYEHIAGELAAGRLSRANFHIAGEAA